MRKFVFAATNLGVTTTEMAKFLHREAIRLDPLVMRDEVDYITSSDGWPKPEPAWKVDLMTFVRRSSGWRTADVARFELSLQTYLRN